MQNLLDLNHLLGRPYIRNLRSYVLLLMFVLFLALCSAISPRCLGRLPGNLRRDWKCVHLDNVGLRIGGCPENDFAFLHLGPKSPELPRAIAMKLCQMMENRWNFIG